MSRTDRTRPYWVKILQDHAIEVHDHTRGHCDIAGQRPTRENVGWRSKGRCYFDGDWGNPETGLWCGCPYCTGKLWLSPTHPRVIRREGKRQLRDWWKEWD